MRSTCRWASSAASGPGPTRSSASRTSTRSSTRSSTAQRSEEHTSELQSHRYLPSFPTRRSSDLKHVPLGLECRERAWAYSVVGFQDFDAIEYQIFNRSGHTLDSMYVAWLVEIGSGPAAIANFF